MAEIKEIRAILKEDNSAGACLNSACLSKKHANNLQLKMCQIASNQEERHTFFIFYHMYRVYVHIK